MKRDNSPHPGSLPPTRAPQGAGTDAGGLFIKLTSSLRLRFVFALAILFASGFLTQMRINTLLSDSINDSVMINTAGRQRMLSERIARDAFIIGSAYEQGHWSGMYDAIADAKRHSKELLEGHNTIVAYLELDHNDRESTSDLLSSMSSIKPQIDRYIRMIDKVCLNADKRNQFNLNIKLRSIANDEYGSLASLDTFVDQFAAYASAKVDKTRSMGWGMYTLLVGIGLASLILVVEPGVRAHRKALALANISRSRAERSEQELAIHNKATNQASIVMTTNLKGEITHVNDAFCEISGYSREELLGSNCRIINSGHHPRSFFKHMFATIGSGELWHGEVCNRRKDGSLYWIDTTVVPILNDQGKIESYYSLRIDITQQKESQRELQTILDALPSMIIYKDENNTILRVNQAVANVIGRDPEDISGHQSSEFLAGKDSIDRHEDDLEIMENGQPIMGRIESVALPNGVNRTMRIDKIPMIDESESHSRIVTIATDITETVEMEQRFSLAIESTKAGVWDWDINEKSIVANERYFEMLGDTAVQNPVKSWYYNDRLHPDDRERIIWQISDVKYRPNDPFTAEFRLLHNDGNYRWIKSSGKVTEVNPDGTAARMIGQHLDIDASKRLDLSIRTALELQSKGTQEETIIELTSALAKATRASFAGVSRIFEKDGELWARMTAGVHNGQPAVPFEYRLAGTPCERTTELEFCFYPDEVVSEFPTDQMLVDLGMRGYAGTTLTNSNGELIGLLFIMNEDPLDPPFDPRTALKLFGARAAVELEHSDTQEKLRKAAELAKELSKSKSDFLANMSHEIRTPMTAILGFADLLEEDGDASLAPKRRIEAIKTIQNNGNHLLAIINDILDISKIEAGKMRVELMETNPIEVLQQVESLMGSRARGKGLELNIEFATDIPETISSDPTRLRQILINLIGNGIKFTENGSVTLRSSLSQEDHPMFIIDVIDTGIGMSQKQCGSVFEAFSQADMSTTRKFGGTGLGLNISASLAEMLGGRISVTSELGKGSCFTITIDPGDIQGIPLVGKQDYHTPSAPSTNTRLDPSSKPRLEGRQILLVEDGPDNQRLISYHLRKAGAQVDVAENGRIAVDTLMGCDAPHYDVVLMDMQMPVLDGYSAATELRDRGFTTPIIALTAHAMESDRQKCLNAGCTAYQTKPIDKHALISECVEQIGRGQQGGFAERNAA